MSKKQDDQSSATAAYLRGLQNDADSIFWLKRAGRLAPNDPRIELEIARKELSRGKNGAKRAYRSFEPTFPK